VMYQHFETNQETIIRFFFYCLGLTKDKKPPAGFEELPEEKWAIVLMDAQKHSILPLLYYHLTQFHKEIQIPTNILKQLKQAYFHSSLENTQVYYDLSKVLGEANISNIPIIVLKGVAIASSIYPNVALRPMSDLDLLVKSEDIRMVHELLLRLGWKCMNGRVQSENRIKFNHALLYKKYELYIDLHLKIIELPKLNPWTNAVSIKIDFNKTLVLGTGDIILFLCNHLCKHITSSSYVTELIKFYDIAQVLRKSKESIDWNYIVQNAYINQCEHIIYCILDFIKTEFEEDIPTDVLSKLKNKKFTVQISDVLYKNKKLPDTIYGFEPIAGIIRIISSRWLIPKSVKVSDVIRYTFKRIFPSKEYMLTHYPIHQTRFFFIYYLIRIPIGVAKILKILYKHISYSMKNRINRSINN